MPRRSARSSPPGRRSRFAAAALNAALALGGVLFALGVVEAYLRYDDRRPDDPLVAVDVAGTTYRLHEKRERLGDLENSIVFLGDSFTAAGNCGVDETYPAVFGRLARQAGLGQAVNLGIPGQNTFDYLKLLEGLLREQRIPRGIVVTLYANDFGPTCSLCPYLAAVRRNGDFDEDEIARLEALCASCAQQGLDTGMAHVGTLERIHIRLHDAFHVYKLIRRALLAGAGSLGWQLSRGHVHLEQWSDPTSLSFRLVALSLARIAAGAARAGVPVLVVFYPDVVQVREDNPDVALYARGVEALSRASGVPVLSGYPAFLGAARPRLDWTHSLVDSHPSCAAHAVFAAWAFDRYRTRLGTTRPAAAPDRPRVDPTRRNG